MPTLTCVIERITFFNEENGYSVLRVTPEQAKAVPEDAYNQEGMVNVVGALPRLSEGEVIEFSGDWVTDPRYGIQFKAVTAVPILPTSKRGITRYLSDLVDGVGKKTAQKIVDHFGVETLTVLNTAPDRLYEVKGIRTEQVADIITTWKETHEERSVMIFLQQYGVTPNLAKKVYDAYGTHTIQQVQDNPYRLADDIYGVGFQKADSIAQEMGMKVNSAERVGAGLTLRPRTPCAGRAHVCPALGLDPNHARATAHRTMIPTWWMG
ncbi:MAG UNVERIFIED_CONTAM: helix-hairpin-helix domain-containing protein [Anaerolineae bacterium]|jgi:exodeoxyribonuclease V alpha subunit